MFAKIENGKVLGITIGDISLCKGEILLPEDIDIEEIDIFAKNGFFEKENLKNCINVSNPDKKFDLLEIL